MNFKKRKDFSNQELQSLMNEHSLSENLAQLLLMRDIDSSHAYDFLNPSLEKLTPLSCFKNLDDIVLSIKNYIDNNGVIVIYGDYDCDGICGVSILYNFLKSVGANVFYFLPNRFKNGYGLTIDALEMVAEKYLPDLIITVDCGISSVEEVNYCNDLGIDIIITDHHEPQSELPSCLILNPKINENGFKDYCGAGVVLRLVEALSDKNTSMDYLDICAIATVGDIVPMLEDNRVLVYYGLKMLKTSKNLGVKVILEKLGLSQKMISSTDIAFKIVPKINSVGRLGDCNEIVDIFCSDDYFTVSSLMDKIIKSNEERQQLTEEVVENCLEIIYKNKQYKKNIIVIYSEFWHEGVLGIACSRLVDLFNKPVILLSKNKDIYKGSCRSVDSINVFEILCKFSHFMVRFGGHKSACGMSVRSDNIQEFKDSLENYFDSLPKIKEEVVYDFILENALTVEEYSDFLKIEPCGEKNPSARVLIKNVNNFEQISSKEHIKANLSKEFSLIAFNNIENLNFYNSNIPKFFEASMCLDEFNNKRFVNCLFKKCYIEKDDFSDEYFYLDYAKQLLKKGELIDENNVLEMDFCKTFLKNSMYDSVFLCYTTSSFNKFKNFLAKEGLLENISFAVGKCNFAEPKNLLLLNPNVNCNLQNYENVVFLDKPLKKSSYENMIGKSSQVYFVGDFAFDLLSRGYCNFDELKEIYLQLKNVLTKPVFGMQKLSNLVAYENKEKVFFTINVLYDLKIIKLDKVKGFYLDNSVKTKLAESEYYKTYSKLLVKDV